MSKLRVIQTFMIGLFLAGLATHYVLLDWSKQETTSIEVPQVMHPAKAGEAPGAQRVTTYDNSTLASDSEEYGTSDSWKDPTDIGSFLAQMEAHTDSVLTDLSFARSRLLESCVRAELDTAQWGRWESRYGPSPRSTFREKLKEQCSGVLPSTFDLNDPLDTLAVYELIEEMRGEGSVGEKGRLLESSIKAGGEALLAETALDILLHSLDVGSLTTAIRHLVRNEIIDSDPGFGNIGIHMESSAFVSIVDDVATVISCDRLGGCSKGHPILNQRCFESPFGCNEPHDIYEAIYQLRSPLEYEVFAQVLGDTRAFVRNHGRLGSVR